MSNSFISCLVWIMGTLGCFWSFKGLFLGYIGIAIGSPMDFFGAFPSINISCLDKSLSLSHTSLNLFLSLIFPSWNLNVIIFLDKLSFHRFFFFIFQISTWATWPNRINTHTLEILERHILLLYFGGRRTMILEPEIFLQPLKLN